MVLIEKICEAPQIFVMGAAAVVGAVLYGSFSVWQKKKADKNFKFSWPIMADTVWQSTLAGGAAGMAMGCSWGALFIAMLGGIGIDRVTNKVKVGQTQIFNFVQMVSNIKKK